MSLTNEEKEIALYTAMDWIEEGTTDEQLLMFVDLFLSLIREEQKAVPGVCLHDDYGPTLIGKRANLDERERPLFTTPPAVPAIEFVQHPAGSWDNPPAAQCNCDELVEALKGMIDMYTRLVDSGDCGFWCAEEVDEVIKGNEALANHAKRMKGGE